MNKAITKKTLKEFWNDSAAPAGFAYFKNDKPFAQLHFFDKCFTVFFHIEPQISGIIADFQRVKQNIIKFFIETNSNNHPRLYHKQLTIPQYSSVIKNLRFTEGVIDRHVLHSKPLNRDTLKEIENAIRDFSTYTASLTEISFELKNTYLDKENQSIEIAYWKHTATTDCLDKEQGFTIHFDDYTKQNKLIDNTVKLVTSSLVLEDWAFVYDLIKYIENHYIALKEKHD